MSAEIDLQEVTLNLPRETLQRAKDLAAARHSSLPQLVQVLLEELVSSEDQYALARSRQLDLMREGLQLGTLGRALTSRDELHDR